MQEVSLCISLKTTSILAMTCRLGADCGGAHVTSLYLCKPFTYFTLFSRSPQKIISFEVWSIFRKMVFCCYFIRLTYARESLASIIIMAMTVAFAKVSSASRKGEFEFNCPLHRPTAICCKAVLRHLGPEIPILCSACKNAKFLPVISYIDDKHSWDSGMRTSRH